MNVNLLELCNQKNEGIVISASDDRYRGLYVMKQTHKWFDGHEYPSLGLRRGVRTLQRITVDNKLVEVRVQTSEHKRLLIIKSLHTNNNDYYHI